MKIKELHILFFVLFLHAFASAFTGFYEGGTLNPGTVRGGLVTLFVLYFISRRFRVDNKVVGFLVIYLIYLGFLTFLSSSFYTSFYLYIGVFISLMMFPIGFYYIYNEERLFQLSKVLLYVLAFITGTVLVSNILGVGTSDYLEDSFYFGGGRVNITKTMVILLFSAPIYLYMEKASFNRRMAIIVYLTALAICLIGIKRSVLLALVVGVGIFLIFGPNLKRSAKYVAAGGFLFLLSLPLYGDLFTERFQAREERIQITEETLDAEARYNEVFMVTTAIEQGSWKHRLIGSELFNDREFFNTRRMLHTDYMILLNGSGVFGFFGWFIFLGLLLMYKVSLYKRIEKNDFIQILNAVFWMLIAAQLLISISGTVYSITLRSYLFLLLGAILCVMKKEASVDVR